MARSRFRAAQRSTAPWGSGGSPPRPECEKTPVRAFRGQRPPDFERVTGIEPALSAWEPYKIPRPYPLASGQSGIKWPGVTPGGPPYWPANGLRSHAVRMSRTGSHSAAPPVWPRKRAPRIREGKQAVLSCRPEWHSRGFEPLTADLGRIDPRTPSELGSSIGASRRVSSAGVAHLGPIWA